MGNIRRRVGIPAAMLLAALCLAPGAQAFTDKEVDEIFTVFDANGDGKVTRTEFDFKKILIIYRNVDTDPIAGVAFEQTKISRRYFDQLDSDRNGRLSPLEITDGLRFDFLIASSQEYFTYEEFRRFMQSISP